jgi:putative transposase
MNQAAPDLPEPKPRSSFSHYLPRLKRVFYQADAVVFWTLPVSHRQEGWLTDGFHAAFREMMLHAAAREGLLCPAYCLMPDHLHLVWMGVRREADQRNGMKFLRAQLGPFLQPAKFQHQAHDHVLTAKERQRQAFSVACADYVLLNPLRAGLVQTPAAWPYLGAVIPGYPRLAPFDADYWPWFWKHYFSVREPGLEQRVLPPREME